MPIGALAVKRAQFGSGIGNILLDNLLCTGSETSLIDCMRRDNITLFGSDCDHSEDAGVICEGKTSAVQHTYIIIGVPC